MRVVVVDAQCVVVGAWTRGQQTIYVRASGRGQPTIYVLNVPLDGGGTKRVEVVQQQQGCDLVVHVDTSSADALDRWEFNAGTANAHSMLIGSPQQD